VLFNCRDGKQFELIACRQLASVVPPLSTLRSNLSHLAGQLPHKPPEMLFYILQRKLQNFKQFRAEPEKFTLLLYIFEVINLIT
jgi:hypothetical protein